jgi:hypothetical protein
MLTISACHAFQATQSAELNVSLMSPHVLLPSALPALLEALALLVAAPLAKTTAKFALLLLYALSAKMDTSSMVQHAPPAPTIAKHALPTKAAAAVVMDSLPLP